MLKPFSFTRVHGSVCSLPHAIRRKAGSSSLGAPEFTPLIDVNPGSEAHWKDENYASHPKALQKFLKDQKHKFNDIADPPREPDEPYQEYHDRCKKLREEYYASNPVQVSDEDVKA